jgi:hypothetical protein
MPVKAGIHTGEIPTFVRRVTIFAFARSQRLDARKSIRTASHAHNRPVVNVEFGRGDFERLLIVDNAPVILVGGAVRI